MAEDVLRYEYQEVNGYSLSRENALAEAQQIIDLFDKTNVLTKKKKRKIASIESVISDVSSKKGIDKTAETVAYIVNFENDMGYAVVSGDYRVGSVLAAAPQGNIRLDADEEIPPALAVFFANTETLYSQRIQMIEMEEPEIETYKVYRDWEVMERLDPLIKTKRGKEVLTMIMHLS